MRTLPGFIAMSCAILALSVSAQIASAQRGPVRSIRLIPLDRDAKSLVGAPVSFGPDTVTLVVRGRMDTLKVAVGSLRGIDESRGRRSNWDRGALIGGLMLGITGAIATPLVAEAFGEGESQVTEAIGLGFGAGAVAGAVLGAGIGALSSRDSWTARPLVSLRPADQGGMSLGLSFGVGF